MKSLERNIMVTQPIFIYLPLRIARDIMNEAHDHPGQTPSIVLVDRLRNGYYIGTGSNPKQEIEMALINIGKNMTTQRKLFSVEEFEELIERLSVSTHQKFDPGN